MFVMLKLCVGYTANKTNTLHGHDVLIDAGPKKAAHVSKVTPLAIPQVTCMYLNNKHIAVTDADHDMTCIQLLSFWLHLCTTS